MALTTKKKKDRIAGLSPQQILFVAEYVSNGGNGKLAAIAAGYSEKGAEVQASRLLHNPKVRERVDMLNAKALHRAEVQAADVLREVARIAFLDPRQAFDSEGRLLQVHKLPDDVARSMASIETDESPIEVLDSEGRRVPSSRTHKVKFLDKLRALELLGKKEKLWTDKVQSESTTRIVVENPFAEGGGQ